MALLAAVILVAFGVITGLSIGPPFLVLGLGLLILHPFRLRRRVYWPLVAGLVTLLGTTLLLTPMWCTASGLAGGGSTTTCSNLIGQTWSGSGVEVPPPEARQFAIAVGLALGGVALVATWMTLTVRGAGRGVRSPGD